MYLHTFAFFTHNVPWQVDSYSSLFYSVLFYSPIPYLLVCCVPLELYTEAVALRDQCVKTCSSCPGVLTTTRHFILRSSHSNNHPLRVQIIVFVQWFKGSWSLRCGAEDRTEVLHWCCCFPNVSTPLSLSNAALRCRLPGRKGTGK